MSTAIIVARGGSQRIPKKNIRPFFGKPIIAYSIETARESKLFRAIYVSTDDDQIAKVARGYRVTVMSRPAALARNEVGTQEVMQYHAKKLPERQAFVCCIYPTAPLMRSADLRLGMELLKKYGADYAFSVGTEPLRDAGQWYWGLVQAFAEGRPLIGPDALMVPIPEERVCDINEERDWVRAERMYAALQERKVA